MLAEKVELVDNAMEQKDEILKKIEDAIKKEEIKLPAIPDIALRIKEAFRDEQYDIGNIARIIQTEAGLTAYVLKIANSPLHRGPLPIKTTKHAICRLGQHSVQNIVVTYTVRSLFETSSSQLKALLKNQWEQSTHIAAISALIAKRCDDFDPDQALLAGLLQDIGALPIISWLKDNHSSDDNLFEEFDRLRANCAKDIGVLILKSWQFADELIEVVRSRENWSRDSGPQVDSADIVTIARHHYYMSKGQLDGCPNITDIPAYHKLPFKALTPDQSLALLEESKEDIDEIIKMMQ